MTYVNPYTTPFPLQQQFMPLQQQVAQFREQVPSLLGRVVNSAAEITPQEVSMSNVPSLFPLADGSAIIAKQWSNDGTIQTIRYSAEMSEEHESAGGISLFDVMDSLDDIKDAIRSIKADRKPTTRRTAKASEKKGSDDEPEHAN